MTCEQNTLGRMGGSSVRSKRPCQWKPWNHLQKMSTILRNNNINNDDDDVDDDDDDDDDDDYDDDDDDDDDDVENLETIYKKWAQY